MPPWDALTFGRFIERWDVSWKPDDFPNHLRQNSVKDCFERSRRVTANFVRSGARLETELPALLI